VEESTTLRMSEERGPLRLHPVAGLARGKRTCYPKPTAAGKGGETDANVIDGNIEGKKQEPARQKSKTSNTNCVHYSGEGENSTGDQLGERIDDQVKTGVEHGSGREGSDVLRCFQEKAEILDQRDEQGKQLPEDCTQNAKHCGSDGQWY